MACRAHEGTASVLLQACGGPQVSRCVIAHSSCAQHAYGIDDIDIRSVRNQMFHDCSMPELSGAHYRVRDLWQAQQTSLRS